MAGEFKLAKWFVEIGEKGSSKVLRAVDGVKGKLAGLPRSVSLDMSRSLKGMLLAGGALGLTIKLFKDMMREEESAARFGVVFRNAMDDAGKAVAYSRAEMDLIAKALQTKTGFRLDEIRDAMRELIDIGGVGGGQFIRALEVAGDVAHANSISMGQAAQQIGFALADPTKAERMLRAAKEPLTPQERETLKNARLGAAEWAKAQDLVLQKYGKDIAGMTAAMQGTLSGSWREAMVEIRAILRQYGGPLIEGVKYVVKGGAILLANIKTVLPLLGRTIVDVIKAPFTYLADTIVWAVHEVAGMLGIGPGGGAKPQMQLLSPETQARWLALWAQRALADPAAAQKALDALRNRPGIMPELGSAKPVKLEILNLDETWSKLQDAMDGGRDDQARAADGIEDLLAKWDEGVKVKNLPQLAWA